VLSVVGSPRPSPPWSRSAEKGYGTTRAHIAAMGAVAVDGPALPAGHDPAGVDRAVFTFAERRL